uniref:Uncharacterized protein n=1 Tax=Branchiostoma floridae TaxID=7739 RepID=C3ZIR0_BRAFL|eukprot:XP_002591584.1 hypothetical protein BRAFLDRAFT_105118 [Branchiostoma floridae]
MDASAKQVVDTPVISDNSDIDTVCQEAINELLKKTMPTETDITLCNHDDSLLTEESGDVREDDTGTVEEEKQLISKKAVFCKESCVKLKDVVRSQPSPQPSTSTRECPVQRQKDADPEQVPGTSMSNILYDIGLEVVSDFMQNSPANHCPKKTTDKKSKNKRKNAGQQEVKKYYCRECPAYYYDLGCMYRHLKNVHKLYIPTEELRNYYRRTTVRRKGSKMHSELKDKESMAVGAIGTESSKGKVEGEEKVPNMPENSTMMSYRCTLCPYNTFNYAKLLLHVQVLHGKAQIEQDVVCKVSSPISPFATEDKPLNKKPVLLLKTENRFDAQSSETKKPVHMNVIPVKRIVLVKKKSRADNIGTAEVQQPVVKKLEDFIALACPFCEERPKDKTILKKHLKTVHNMNIVEECKLAQLNTVDSPDLQEVVRETRVVAEDVSEDKKASASMGQTCISEEAQTQENELCSSDFEKELQKDLPAAYSSEESKVGDKNRHEQIEDNHAENECAERENTSFGDTEVSRTTYSLSQLMPLVCKLCLQVHVRCSSIVRHMRCAHNVQVHCQEKFDIPLSGQYFNGRDCRFCGYVARDKMTFFVHLGHFHKIVHYAALATKYQKQLETSRSKRKIVPRSESLKCLDCGFITTSLSHYQRHRRESHISKPRSCHFKSDQLKNENEKDATNANEDTTKCTAKSLPPTKSMRKQLCEECGEAFTYAYEKDYHVFKVHKNKQKEEPDWGRRRKTREPVTTGKSKRKKLCEECGQTFLYAYEKDYHVFKVHKNKQKEGPDLGGSTPREPIILDVSLPVKKETDEIVKVARKCTKRKRKEAKGDKEETKRVAKGKRRKVDENRFDDGAKVKVGRSEVVRKVVMKTSTATRKSSSGCYKHKKKFMPANETTLKEWEHLLKASYACNQYPSREEIQRLAMETGQEFALIRTWFAYERQNQKLGPRPRNVYYKQSTDHTAYMEKELQKNPKPTVQDMSRIADKTGLSRGLVIYWFKKRLNLAGLNLEELVPETETTASAGPVSSMDDQSSSKDQEQGELVQLKVPHLDIREVHCRKSRQSRRKGIPKKSETEEDQIGKFTTEHKEGDKDINNKPRQDGSCVKDMTDFDSSSIEKAGDGNVKQKLQRRPIDELVSKVAARVMSDKDMVDKGDCTVYFDSKENEEHPEDHDLPEMESFSDEMSVPRTEKEGQQSIKKPEKVHVKNLITPMNLKAQRKSMVRMVKQQEESVETLKKSSSNVQMMKQSRSGRPPCLGGPNVLNLSIKEKETDLPAQDQPLVPTCAQNDEKLSPKKSKISHQKARALANMIPYYCCLVCDPTPVRSPDKLEATAFTQYRTLTQHLREKHNIQSRFEHHFTIKKFPNVKTNTQEKYQCQYCPIYYHMPGFLVKHLRDKHGVKDQIVKGSAHFEIVKSEIMENMGSGKMVKTVDKASGVPPKSSHGWTVTQYCCVLCPKSTTKDEKTRSAFLQFKSLEDHLMTSHQVMSDFNMYCTSQQVPVLEISKHDVVTYAKHRCKLCNAQYNYIGFMVRHLNEKHELKDLDVKWSNFVEVVTPDMKSCSEDCVQREPSYKALGKVGTNPNSKQQQVVQEQYPSPTSPAKPIRSASNLSPSSSALDLSLPQKKLKSAQSGHIIYQCTLCKSFFRFYTNATDHLGTKHAKYGTDCEEHIKERSAKIVEFGQHQKQDNSSSANQEANEGSSSLTKNSTVAACDAGCNLSNPPSESSGGFVSEGYSTDFSTLDVSCLEAEGVIYECLTCKAVFPKWALLVRHYECCTWDSSLHLNAIVRIPKEVMESFFAKYASGFECSFCYMTIEDQTMLASHLQMHTQPHIILRCEGEEDEERKDSDYPIATSAAKIAQYTLTPLSQSVTITSQEEMSTTSQDLNQK